MSNLGALTTPFVAPSDCTSSFSNLYVLDTSPVLIAGPISVDRCLPGNFEDPRTDYYWQAVCPAGYSTGCATLTSDASDTVWHTVATCCPSLSSMYVVT
jgi:hypothetical protein